MLTHLDDIRSDLSVFHRVDDMDSLPANRFWPLVERLAFYDGVVAAMFRHQHATPVAEPTTREAPQPMAVVTADNANAVLANPFYGDVPGLAAVFSHTRVPGGE